jgi:hypothetical protein
VNGFSVAHALLRYEVLQKANSMKDLSRLSHREKATLVDEILIRCGDRKTRTIEQSRYSTSSRETNGAVFISKYGTLLQEFEIKIIQ